MYGENWLAIKDLQYATLVLKTGHLVSCSSLCMLYVVRLVCTVWFVGVRFLGSFLFFLLLLGLVCYTFDVCTYCLSSSAHPKS